MPKRLQMGEEIENNEVKIYESGRKLAQLKNRWREGLKGRKPIMAEKNPIAFFGDLLTQK